MAPVIMKGSDQPEDGEAVEVNTYDSSQFQPFQPDSLALDQAVVTFIQQAAQVRVTRKNFVI
jgi:hypothetical protein